MIIKIIIILIISAWTKLKEKLTLEKVLLKFEIEK